MTDQWTEEDWYNQQVKWYANNCTSREEYISYLQDERWNKRREEIFERKGRICKCGETEDLQIHHIKYGYKYPWDNPDEDLVVLCRPCHKKAHHR